MSNIEKNIKVSAVIFSAMLCLVGCNMTPVNTQVTEGLKPFSDFKKPVENKSRHEMTYDERVDFTLNNPFEFERVKQLTCLSQTIYGESRGESELGMRLVAEVIEYRRKSSRYPNTYCGVVMQRKQFSVWNEGEVNQPIIEKDFMNPKPNYKVLLSIKISLEVMEEGAKILPSNTMYYHASTMEKAPNWSRSHKLEKVEQVGNHIFYKRL